MKKDFKSRVFLIIFLMLILFAQTPAYASDETQTIKVAMSEDESIIVERILYTALKRLGYQMSTKTAGMRTTVNDVNFGDAAIVPAQTSGLEEEYTNLIKVPVPISYVESNAYTRSSDPYEFSKWSDLQGLRLSHCWKNLYITRNVPRAGASEVVTLNEYEDLWASLLAGETDVSVIPNLTGFVRIVPEGIKMAGVIEREPRYTYVNKEYEYLVPLLTEVYQSMTDDGTIDSIRASNQTGDKKTILHISSYSAHVEWERGISDAIRRGLEMNPGFDYQNLNLNARQIHNKANINNIISSTVRTNFIERNPDIIIVSDNDALEFVLNNYYMLFPKVPVVFCGVNDFDKSMLYGFEDYVTGVAEAVSLYDTVGEMLRLFPETKHIYVLNDYTSSGFEWRQSIEKSFSEFDFGVELEFNEDKPFAELLEDISGLSDDTMVLLATYFSDSDNAFYNEREVQEQVCAVASKPVFCLANSFHGNGTFGGKVSVSDAHGMLAGTMARDILLGKDVSEFSVITDSEYMNQWHFDYDVAQKYGIDVKSLPSGHVALNRDLPIWETNPFETRLVLTAGMLLLIIISGLIVFLRLMGSKNARLVEIQSHLHSAEELLEKDDGLRRMIDSMPVSVLIADIDTNKPEYCNQAFLTANGLDSLTDADSLNLLPLMKRAEDGLTRNKAYTFTCADLRDPGGEVCQRITAEKLVYKNKNCLVLISEDITAQIRETQMLTNAAQKEKEANMLKGMFLANMSHEIRTPMNAIIGLSQLALTKSQTLENESFFSKISSSSKNLLSIINDILDFSKIEADKLELSEAEFELEETISNAFIVAVDRVENKPLEILLDMESDVPCYLYGDSTRLWQILRNVLDNAVKYTAAGRVLLSVSVESSSGDDVTLCFKVSDTGIGMSPEQLQRLFTPFEQLHQKDFKSKRAGTGLGMSISRQLVNLMGGHIEVSSKVDAGTIFSITIPFKLASKRKTIRDLSREFAESTGRQLSPVLLVDDDQISLRIMSMLLDTIGVSSVCVSDSAAALETLDMYSREGKPINTLIVDYLLGGENGLELAKRVRQQNQGVRILMVTAYIKQVLPQVSLSEAGIEEVIEKPFVVSSFIKKVCGAKPEIPFMQQERKCYSTARVLLCEDNEINQIVAEGMLKEFGITPVIASNGREALDILETQEFDLIFMDIIMPVMDGHEATVAIRQGGKPYKDTPICSLTANVMVDEVSRCIAEGVNAHIEKPISFDSLAAVLDKILAELAD